MHATGKTFRGVFPSCIEDAKHVIDGVKEVSATMSLLIVDSYSNCGHEMRFAPGYVFACQQWNTLRLFSGMFTDRKGKTHTPLYIGCCAISTSCG